MKNPSSHAPPAPYRKQVLRSLLPAAVLVICVGGLGYLQFRLSEADDVLRPELARLEAEWTKLAPRLEEAKGVRDRYEAFLSQAGKIKSEDGARDWVPAFHVLIGVRNPGVELRGVQVGRTPEARTWQMQVDGVASGTAPRIVMEGYRKALQHNMDALFRVQEPFELQNGPKPAPEDAANPARAAFSLTSTFSPKAK